MPSFNPDDMVGNIEVYMMSCKYTLWFRSSSVQSLHRLKYRLTTGPVFPNLSTSSLGDALNLETFRKIFKNMMDGRHCRIASIFVICIQKLILELIGICMHATFCRC